jgi:hypothetical protein
MNIYSHVMEGAAADAVSRIAGMRRKPDAAPVADEMADGTGEK